MNVRKLLEALADAEPDAPVVVGPLPEVAEETTVVDVAHAHGIAASRPAWRDKPVWLVTGPIGRLGGDLKGLALGAETDYGLVVRSWVREEDGAWATTTMHVSTAVDRPPKVIFQTESGRPDHPTDYSVFVLTLDEFERACAAVRAGAGRGGGLA